MASLGRFVFLDWTSWFGAATRTWSWSRWGGESCVLMRVGSWEETKEVSQISKKCSQLTSDHEDVACFSIQFLGGNKKLAPHSRRSELSEGTRKNSLPTCSQIDAWQRWLPPQEVNYLGLTDVIQVAEFYKFVHPDAYSGPRWYMVEGAFFPGDTKNHARIFRGFSFLLLHFLNSQNILPYFFPGLLEERIMAKFGGGGGPYTALYRCGPALSDTSRQPPTEIPRVTNRGLTGSVEQLPQWNWNRLKMMWIVVVSSFLNLYWDVCQNMI